MLNVTSLSMENRHCRGPQADESNLLCRRAAKYIARVQSLSKAVRFQGLKDYIEKLRQVIQESRTIARRRGVNT